MIRLATCLAIAAFTMVSTGLAAADTVYDTVEAIETTGARNIKVTGIIAGQSAPTTASYSLAGSSTDIDAGARCDRLALLAMSKPGKFQFVMVLVSFNVNNCKLVLRAP
ncbi:MAG: hypothetical protein ABIY55_04440 [Kofleriaceae bacterium]